MAEKDFRVKKGLQVDGTGTSSIAGSLGIGTTSPTDSLAVRGGIKIGEFNDTDGAGYSGSAAPSSANTGTGAADPQLRVSGRASDQPGIIQMAYFDANNFFGATTDSTANYTLGKIQFAMNENSQEVTNVAEIRSTSRQVDVSDSGDGKFKGDLQFLTSDGSTSAASLTTKMTITEGGNVGIGTTTPVSRLDLNTGALSFANTNTQLKLSGGSNVDLQLGHWGNTHILIDTDGNDTSRYFSVRHGNATAGSATELFKVTEAGETSVTGNLTVSGDLTINGTTTTIDTTNLAIEDNIVVLNKNVTGTPADVDAGIEIERGDETNATFLWDEGGDYWEADGPGTGNSFIAKNANGYIALGPQNGTYAHITTDMSRFYFNRDLVIGENAISSYNGDFAIRRNQTTDEQITIADNSMTFTSAGNDVLTIDGTNTRLGIGTTSPTAQLEVDGTIKVDPTGTYSAVVAGGSDTSTTAGIVFDGDADLFRESNGYLRRIIGASSSTITIGQTGTSVWNTIDLIPGHSGKVRIYSDDPSTNSSNLLTLTADDGVVNTLQLQVGSGATVSTINTSFSDNDTSLMTSQAIKEKIESYNYITSQMTFVLEDDDGTEVSISNAEEIKFHSGNTSIDINYSDISPGSDADPFDLDFRTIHAPYLKTGDDRDFAPNDLANDIREISGRFSTKTGLEDGSTTNASDYVDALVLDTFTGHTGGDANLLAFAKNSTKRIYHYRADQDDTDWGTASTLAYISDIPTNTNQLTNGAGFITATLTTEQVQDIVGAMFSSNTETRISATYQDGDGTIDLVVDDMTADTNTQLSNEQVQDIVGAMVSSNTETNISVTYDDSNGKLNFASTDTNTTYSAGNGLVLSGTTFKLNDPVNLSQLTESTDATTDKILLWDESASLWKYMTLDDLQDSIDTTGGSGTTINNNADNRIITGSGTANTLNAESTLTWDGSTLIVNGGTGDAVLSLRADSDNSNEKDQPYIEFVLDGGTTHSSIGHSSDVFHNNDVDNNTLIIANSVATNSSGSGIVFKTGETSGHENAVEALRIGPDRKIRFNDEYTFPLNDGSANQVLQTNGSGALTFATISSGGGSSTTGGSKPVVYVDAGNTNVTTTETTIPFDTEVLDPSGNATLSTALGGDGTIRLAAAGYYEISYSIPINDDAPSGDSGADRTRIFAFMQTDDNENWTSPTTVTQSRSQVYTRENSGGSGLSTSFIYEHTANDYIRIRIDAERTTNISTETGQSQISIRLLSTAQDDAFVITGEESDDYITSEPGAGNANGFFPSYGNGAHNTLKSSSGSDFGIVIPFDCTLHRIDLSFANKGSETNSSNQTITVFKNRSASTTTMTYNASGTSGNAFTKSFSSLSGDGLSYSAGDTFNLRATGLSGYTNTQVGPARMTATFLRTQ